MGRTKMILGFRCYPSLEKLKQASVKLEDLVPQGIYSKDEPWAYSTDEPLSQKPTEVLCRWGFVPDKFHKDSYNFYRVDYILRTGNTYEMRNDPTPIATFSPPSPQ